MVSLSIPPSWIGVINGHFYPKKRGSGLGTKLPKARHVSRPVFVYMGLPNLISKSVFSNVCFRPPIQKRIYLKSCGKWSQNLTRHFAISGGFPATIPTKSWADNNQEVWHQPFWKPYRLLGLRKLNSRVSWFAINNTPFNHGAVENNDPSWNSYLKINSGILHIYEETFLCVSHYVRLHRVPICIWCGSCINLFQRQKIVTKSVTNPKYEAKENLDHLPVAMCLFSTLLMASSRSISTNLCNKPNYRRKPIWAYVMTPVPLRATISQPNKISWLQSSHTSWGKVIWWSPNPLFYAKMKWITSSRVILEPL